ncbi:MAG: ribose 5-phosphate isomerase B [Candidatus Omnitrophica bacterium]|nr:ribose 5-phosphate isomerase B [Candidatus Omnitrophota bacterium]
MKIAIGSDHGGFMLKEKMIPYLKRKGHVVLDVGCFSQEPCDYPQYAFDVAKLVGRRKADRGIAICKSGIGNSIVANKVRGSRAALCYNIAQAKSSRQHNDANILVIGAAYTDKAIAKRMLSVWLKTKALGGRHSRRVKQITRLERKAKI